MSQGTFDVVIVGAGAAGLTAAIGLARAGFAVAAVEAAPFPGAENWSGCVYFCENLAHPDILGPEGVEALAWERRLIERGFFATDGHGLLGMTYRDPATFRHCYTVLRPIFDHHLAQIAVRHGVALLNGTTAESLIRDQGRVIGVCTNRGALYGDLVFLAEGDASHLVTREGYERSQERNQAPKFLQGIKQVIEFPPGEIERRFGVGAEEGVAYEMLLRNGTLRGKRVHLNMGGFLYANRQSLSVGLVLPADNLHQHFDGDPNLLTEWFLTLPSLQHWFAGGKQSVFGTKIIRGGGAKDIPTLIDDGLAIGGAASAIGIDFPYPNFTGPATAMGLLLSQAVRRIRDEGGRFTRADLQRHYLEPLRRTHYWQDVDFLSRWPRYVKTTKTFFGDNLDFTLQSAHIWTRPGRGLIRRWSGWLGLLLRFTATGQWAAMREDFDQLDQALRLKETAPRPNVWRMMLDGTLNALRDLFRVRRSEVPSSGAVRLHYLIAGGKEPAGLPPAGLRAWFRRFAPILAHGAHQVYSNNDIPLSRKLPGALKLFLRQVNLFDLIGAGVLACATGVSHMFLQRRRGETTAQPHAPDEQIASYEGAMQRAADMTPLLADNVKTWEERLGLLEYQTSGKSHIHVLWPRALPDKNKVTEKGLWHVCPAHVYEARPGPGGQVQIVVNYENCIKCETCWRTSDEVDWGRDGDQQFVYPVWSPPVAKLLADMTTAGTSTPRGPHQLPAANGQHMNLAASKVAVIKRLCGQLESKLEELEVALAEEPRTIDPARAEYLDMLARYAQQLAARLVELISAERASGGSPAMLTLARETHAQAERCARHAWDRRFSWAAADARQVRFHHLPRLLEACGAEASGHDEADSLLQRWLAAEGVGDSVAEIARDWKRRLDAIFPPAIWRELEHGHTLTAEQDSALRQIAAEVPALDRDHPVETAHPPVRRILLAELGRRDPSLAFRVASHLWARDVATWAGADLTDFAQRWQRAEEWACFGEVRTTGTGREALYVPAGAAQHILLFDGQQLEVGAPGHGLDIELVPTLGLRGAGVCRVRVADSFNPDTAVMVAADDFQRVWSIVSSADLVAIAFGMTDLLCRRAIEQATSRVQFPGLFHDEEARDPIGKFGAIKKMVAEIAAHRYLMETLDQTVAPQDLQPTTAVRAALAKALTAEALGTAPGSVSYNAGQVFGGTAYSEDDLLSKYYRDAAAWRYLGPDNVQVYFRHGADLLAQWDAGHEPPGLLAEESGAVDDLMQRQALRVELDTVRALRARLRDYVSEWRANRPLAKEAGAELCEALGRQEALVWASEALLLRTHARLEAGHGCEIELPLLRVWLEGAVQREGDLEGVVRAWIAAAAREDRPVVDPAAGPPVTIYKDFLAAPAAYNSGDFLIKPVDLVAPRYVPEMIETDPSLAQADREIRTELEKHFGGPRDGMVYERYVEREHRPDDADLDFLRQKGYFRMPIPKALGGAGRSKAEYYLLTTNSHRLADVAVSLTIQVNSSLGSTPVLLARDKDLPKAKKELEAFTGEAALHGEIAEALTRIQGFVNDGNSVAAETAVGRLNKRLEEAAFKAGAVRVLAHAFTQSWQQAIQAGKEHNLPALREALTAAVGHWRDACARSGDFASEMGRRLEASDLFLRWVAAGQISAFALTEPSAGSDTARVATRARLRSVPVEPLPWGGYLFTPTAGKEPRALLDAARLEFREGADGSPHAHYRWSDAAEPALICFDEYDYETDARKSLYFNTGKAKVYFNDIAQLRQRDGQLWYDYWELTGAKMWITNGRMCGIMCLYAKTDEGVTGFVVDRHAEGMIVGKDEDKMGQCGSPTNELSLQAVRVPRENVIGLEGRGQVNALETLNVGRAGIAMSCMCQMGRITKFARDFAAAGGTAPGQTPPPWVGWRLRRMEEERFISEAVAFDIIGHFEHKQTKSVRLESAAAKMLTSELLHLLIERAEDIHGLAGQTQEHLVEKRKRDARVLNIYEGTNEIQRFFVLRDLASEVAKRWQPTSPSGYLGPEALELTHLKNKLREVTEAALGLLGGQVAQNPNLQANCFVLAEAVAWLAAADSTLGRLAWLWRREVLDEQTGPSADVELARRAFLRCALEARLRLRRFEAELPHLRRGFYAPAVRAASLLFDRFGQHATAPYPVSDIRRPLSILVVLDAPAPGLANPVVAGGRLQEPYLVFRPADRSALEAALQLRDAGGSVAIEVITAGPAFAAQHLREMLSLGVDRVRLLVTPGAEMVATDRVAAALADLLRDERSFDLILGGAGGNDSEEGLLAPLVAEALGVPHVGAAEHVAVRAHDAEATALLTTDQGRRTRPLPACITVREKLELRRYSTSDYLANLGRAIDIVSWSDSVDVESADISKRQASAVAAQEGPAPAETLVPLEASHLVLHALGLDGRQVTSSRTAAPVIPPAIQDTRTPFCAEPGSGPFVLAVLAGDDKGNLRPSASAIWRGTRFLAAQSGAKPAVLALVPRQESQQRQFVAEVVALASAPVLLVPVESGLSDEIRGRLLVQCWSQLSPRVRAVVGEPWAEPAFLALAARDLATQRVFARVMELDRRQGGLTVDTGRLAGKVRAQYTLNGKPEVWWFTLTEEATVGLVPEDVSRGPAPVQRWQPPLEQFYGRDDIRRLLEDLKQQTGLLRLSDAEIIIDVGFGVGNRDGYEAVIVPLEKALRELGVRGMMVGGSRKVTEELHILPEDRQIGQSGVSVNPRLLLAVGVSGAPQHLNYIGPRATVVCFNRDPDAPLMTLNRRQPQPRVYPVLGDLFETVPAFMEGLRQDHASPMAGVPKHDVTTPQ